MIGFVIGYIVNLVTFPGVMVHEYAHLKMCHWRDIPVHEVVYFQFGSPAGYVIHEEPSSYGDAFAISVAPFFFNTVLALGLFLTAILLGIGLDSLIAFAGAVLLFWVGVSVGMHAFPSSGDANTLWALAKKHWSTSLLGMLGFPVAILIYIANLLSILWFDAIYTGGLLGLALFITTLV